MLIKANNIMTITERVEHNFRLIQELPEEFKDLKENINY